MSLKKYNRENYFVHTQTINNQLISGASSFSLAAAKFNYHKISAEESAFLYHNKNLRQSSDNVRTQLLTNAGQTSDELKTKLGQKAIVEQFNSLKLKTKDNVNIGQTSDKARTDDSFFRLVGLQCRIVLLIYDLVNEHDQQVTSAVSIKEIANACKTTPLSAQKTIQRLEKKMIIKRIAYKNGRGGWTQYTLSAHIYQNILQNETYFLNSKNVRKTFDKLRTSQPNSSNNNIKTTTTDLPLAWKNLNYSSLKKIGFGEHQIKQLYNHGKPFINLDDLQKSIEHFGWAIEHSDVLKKYAHPLKVLMGVLRHGHLWIEKNYVEPSKKIEDEAKDHVLKKLESMADIKLSSFLNWYQNLDNEQKLNCIPRHFKQAEKITDKLIESFCKEFFNRKIWPQKIEELKNKISID